MRGATRLPLTGNLANFNKLVALTQFTTASAQWDAEIRVEADGHCATPEAAGQLEERVRALITLGKAAAKAKDARALFESIELKREGSDVRLGFRAKPQAVEELLR
jgi:hypothetical protein